MGVMASQITSLTIVYSTVYSGEDQRKHQSSTSLAFVRNYQHKMASNAENVSIGWRHHENFAMHCINPFDAETVKFQANKVNIIAADALATPGARASAAMILTMQCE